MTLQHSNRGRLYSLARALLALGLCLVGGSAPAASPKLGWAGGDTLDHNAANASWYYNWWHTTPSPASFGEFVPLIKFPNNIQTKVDIVAAHANVDTLLVLNEPERADQSNTTVAEALSIWPTIQQGLPSHKLVSPAVSDNAEGRAWIESFMDTVEARNSNSNPIDDLRVDSIAFHWYGASSPNAQSAANSFLSRVDWYHQRFNRPVWITEFAMHDWEGNDSQSAMIQAQADFLEIVIPALESRSYVEKYAFYNWFDDARVFQDPNRAPTVIGDEYVGTLLTGEVKNLGGQSLGTDIVYLRGGELTNSGAAVVDALRGIDAQAGSVSTISGSADWSMTTLNSPLVRVRGGGTLRKTGTSTVGLSGAVAIDGTLHVVQGTLNIAGASITGGGATKVDDGATLGFQSGRATYTFSNHDFEVGGVITGPFRVASASTITPVGESASFTGDVVVNGSVVDVGGAGFTATTPSNVAPVTQGLQLNYDAALDTPGDNVWTNSAGAADSLTFASAVSPIAVSDPAVASLSKAYSIPATGGASGLNGFFDLSGPRSSRDATFEVVFRVDSTTAGANQVIFEAGGMDRGVAFVLNGGNLTFNVDGEGTDINLTQAVAPGWRHAIGVVDLMTGTDTVTLYLDGQLVGTLAGQNINDWAGGNLTGLGAGSSSVTGVASGLGSPFHGAIAQSRYYYDKAFTLEEAAQNFQALTAAPNAIATEAIFGGNLTFDAASTLRLDVAAGGEADRVDVAGALNLAGARLEVGKAGSAPLAAGETFDLLDFTTLTGAFSTITLPALAEGLKWHTGRLAVDGVLAVTLDGDFNGDGSVDAADYTTYRDAAGTTVTPNTGADATGDGVVDAADLAAWSAGYGSSVSFSPPALAVPEASGLSLLMMGSLCALRRRPAVSPS